jgi:hypothetical protein
MVLGILSFLTCWMPFVGALIGLIAIVLAVVSLSRYEPAGFAIAAIVAGLLGAAPSAVIGTTLGTIGAAVSHDIEHRP